MRFLVVKESLNPLLGLNATEKMSLLTVHKENFVSVVENLENDLANNYPDVFDNGLGKLPGKVHLQVDPACQPVILPARKVPVSVKEKFKAELKRLQDLKVIAPVNQPTEWISQFVVAVKMSGDLRVCIDPKPLNATLKRKRYQACVTQRTRKLLGPEAFRGPFRVIFSGPGKCFSKPPETARIPDERFGIFSRVGRRRP